ncbi:MAG: HAD family hydrolase [Candidatus Kerfeldbacteria bacterium]|nr:HAD family hydrolase [Candidatus Kerfeldbacteria bacterium]
MQLIIDFDYTLFDTECLRRKLVAALHVSEDEYRKAEAELKKTQLYTLEAHMQLLAGYPLQKAYHIVDDAQDCVYPDAIAFLEQITVEKGKRIMLFSFGNPQWQRRKIDGSGLVHFFDDIVLVDTAKELHIEQLNIASGSDTLYISDRGSEIDRMKQVLPSIQTIWIRRSGNPYEHEPCHRADITIQSLTEFYYGVFR